MKENQACGLDNFHYIKLFCQTGLNEQHTCEMSGYDALGISKLQVTYVNE